MDLADIADPATAAWLKDNTGKARVPVPAGKLRQLEEQRDKLINDYLASIPESEVRFVQELVAQQQGRVWPPAGEIVRRADPRKSLPVRAEFFRRLPPPVR